MKLDIVNKVCLAECKPETQIYDPNGVDGETCLACNEKCTKCKDDVNRCTECKPGFVLNKDYTCQPTCNSLT
jgi:hypothetical protein